MRFLDGQWTNACDILSLVLGVFKSAQIYVSFRVALGDNSRTAVIMLAQIYGLMRQVFYLRVDSSVRFYRVICTFRCTG